MLARVRYAKGLLNEGENFFADVVEADRLRFWAVVEVALYDALYVDAEVFPGVALGGEIFGGGVGVVTAVGFFGDVENHFAHYGKFAHRASFRCEFCGSVGEVIAE